MERSLKLPERLHEKVAMAALEMTTVKVTQFVKHL
jgi:hypothetical protein